MSTDEFFFVLGQVTGALNNPAIRAYLAFKGVKEDQIWVTLDNLIIIAKKCLYERPGLVGNTEAYLGGSNLPHGS